MTANVQQNDRILRLVLIASCGSWINLPGKLLLILPQGFGTVVSPSLTYVLYLYLSECH